MRHTYNSLKTDTLPILMAVPADHVRIELMQSYMYFFSIEAIFLGLVLRVYGM